MPRRLRQRPDGPDQRRQLRGSNRGEHDRDPRRARRGQVAQARPAGRSPDELSDRRADHAQENGRAQLRLSPAVDGDSRSGRRGGGSMKDVGKIILAIIVIIIVWKIVKGLIGLLVGLAVAGLVVYGAVKLVEAA